MSRASLDKKPEHVSAMFDGVAPRYDRVNSLFTLGLDARWRKKMVQNLSVGSGSVVLDIAAGTGVSSTAIAHSGAWVVGADFSIGMLREGTGRGIPLIGADALHLPFPDNSFDAVGISFGLRNVVNPADAMIEVLRILKPGGRFVILETSMPTLRIFQFLFRKIGYRFARIVGKIAGSNADAYSYFIESVTNWPDAKTLTQILDRAGYSSVKVTRLLGSAVAIHRAVK